jgi:hypothetical protein
MFVPVFGFEIHTTTLSSDFTMVDGTVFTGAKGLLESLESVMN